MMKELLNYKLYLRPALIFLSSVVVLGAVIIPQILAYFNVRGSISSVQGRVSSLEAKAQELENVDEVEYKKRLDSLFTALPKEKEVPTAMVVLQSLMTQSGLIVDSVKLIDTPSKSTTTSYILSIFVAGQKESLKNFLISLLESPRVFKLESIDAQSVRGGAGLEAEIQVSVYYDPTSAITTSVDQPLPRLTAEEERILNEIISQVSSSSFPISVDTIEIPVGKDDPFQ